MPWALASIRRGSIGKVTGRAYGLRRGRKHDADAATEPPKWFFKAEYTGGNYFGAKFFQ